MPYELIHTSARRGLHMGTDCYCTVAESSGIPKALATQLERLSGYRHRVKERKPDLVANPVAFSHIILIASGSRYHVISRIADAGFDHSDRTNYLAHHVALTPDELPDAGPAWLCLQERVFQTQWPDTSEPTSLKHRSLPDRSSSGRKCKLWERVTGDAGWAGVLAETYSAREPTYIIYRPGQPVLDLLVESLALVPLPFRWRVTFNTYYTSSSSSECQWRFVPNDSSEADTALTAMNGLVLRLDATMNGEPEGPLADAARTGVMPLVATLEPEPDSDRTEGRRERTERRRPRAAFDEAVPEEEPSPSQFEHADRAGEPNERTNKQRPQRQPVANNASSIKPLLLGAALGLTLGLVGMVFAEIVTKDSLLRHFGVEGNSEKNMRADDRKRYDEEKAEWEKGKAKSEDALTIARRENGSLTSKRDELQTELGKWKAAHEKLLIGVMIGPKAENIEVIKKQLVAAQAESERVAKEAQKSQKELLDFKRHPPIIVPTPLSFLNGSVQVLPKGENASIEFLPDAWGVVTDIVEVKTKRSITITKGETKFTAQIEYDSKTGQLLLSQKGPFALGILAGAVLKINPERSPPQYFQLAPPTIISSQTLPNPKPDAIFKLNLFDRLSTSIKDWSDDKPLGFYGLATVKINDKEYTLVPPAVAEAAAPFPSKLVGHGANGKMVIEMSIDKGTIEVKYLDTESVPSAPKINIIWAEVVPAKRLEGLSAPPILARIQR